MVPSALPRPYSVPALEKGLDVLELLSARATPQSLADLARGLGRNPGEIFRMLNCLERRGYVAREDGTGRFRLTLRLYALAHTHSPVEQLLRAAERPMRDLSRELRESLHLSVLSEGRLVVLAQEESPEPRRLSIEVGGVFSPVHTASGRLLLSRLPRTELERNPEVRALDGAGRAKLLRQLNEIRRAGVSVARGESIAGVVDTAALVGERKIGVWAAVCVPSLAPGDYRDAVLRCAARITRNLGLER